MGQCATTASDKRTDHFEELVKCNADNTPKFTLENRRVPAKVVRVVDGDTVDLAMILAETGRPTVFRMRLYGIDTPEKRPLKSSPTRDAEIAAARLASSALTAALAQSHDLVDAHISRADKYGRWLVTLFPAQGGVSLNDWMIQQGHAKPYFGGSKEGFSPEGFSPEGFSPVTQD